MLIYKDEPQHLVNETTASICAEIRLTDAKDDVFANWLEKIRHLKSVEKEVVDVISTAGKHTNPELMYGSAILVSTVMNLNDDIFLAEETWKARYTPINTPYDNEHQRKFIIGHIIDARVLDKEGTLVDPESSDIPDYFDIEVDWVLYKHLFGSIAKEIEEKAPKGEKFVSMECKFNDFDYGLIDPNTGEAKIVKRNEDTSFLTKYLRRYGGSGEYKGMSLGRVLRDITFVGMGNVSEPGNPKSEYTSISNYNFELYNNLSEANLTKPVIYITKDEVMQVETLDQAKTVIADLTTKVETLTKQVDEQKQEDIKVEIASLTEQVNKLTDDLAAANTKADAAEQKLSEANKQIETVKQEAETVKADLQKKTDELDKINQEAKASKRLNELKELGLEIKEEKIASIVGMSDDAFASVLDFTKSLTAKASEEKTTTTEVAETEKKAEEQVTQAEEEKKDDVTQTAGDDKSDSLEVVAAKLANFVVKKAKNEKKSSK